MVSAILIVFLLQLFIHLVNTIGAETLNEIIWTFYNKLIPTSTSKSASEETRLRREILRLKRELNSTSAQDDFAKWAKLRRQHDKAQEDYKELTSTLSSAKSSFTSRLNTSRWILVNGGRLYIQWKYSRQAMFWIPKGWVPYYVEWIVSFPRAPLGSVSVQTWGLACGTAIAIVVEAITALVALAMGSPQKAKERSKVAVSVEEKKER